MKNHEIREKIKQNRLFHYEVAAQIGISEYTLCVWLRKELTPERRGMVLAAIESLISIREGRA